MNRLPALLVAFVASSAATSFAQTVASFGSPCGTSPTVTWTSIPVSGALLTGSIQMSADTGSTVHSPLLLVDVTSTLIDPTLSFPLPLSLAPSGGCILELPTTAFSILQSGAAVVSTGPGQLQFSTHLVQPGSAVLSGLHVYAQFIEVELDVSNSQVSVSGMSEASDLLLL